VFSLVSKANILLVSAVNKANILATFLSRQSLNNNNNSSLYVQY